MVLGLVTGVGATAYAFEDSGVHTKSCASGYWGKLSVYQRGDGVSYGPGDYSSAPQSNGYTSSYRWVYDNGTYPGGGQWRVASNLDFTTNTASCVNLG